VLEFYAWLRRHPMLVDGPLAIFIALLGIAPTVRAVSDGRAAGVLVLIGLVVPLVFRRRYPVGAFVTMVAAGGLQVVLLLRGSYDVAMLIALYTLAAYRPRRISVPGLVVCLLGSAVAVVAWMPNIHGGSSLFRFGAVTAVFAGPTVLAWVLGDSMRWRRGYYRALEERAARLEAERDAQAQIAAAAERARIARELHDVVAHNVSVMVVQADGAAYALDNSPEQTRDALAAISRTGRQALAEMRHLLGVLRTAASEQVPVALEPQPGLEQIADLLTHSRTAGLPVSFTVEGVPHALPSGIALAAYRVVQESLTNTRKHGGPEVSAAVTMRFCEDGVKIVVSDDGHRVAGVSDGAGHGLVGMRERVEMYGGTVKAGPRDRGGYRVSATIPFGAPADGPAPGSASPGSASPGRVRAA
jgi:signal transduction histidine kinase